MDYAEKSRRAKARIKEMLLQKRSYIDIRDSIEDLYGLGELFLRRKIESIISKQEQDLRNTLLSKGKTESEIEEILKNTIYRGD